MAVSAMQSVRVDKSATCGRKLVFTSKFAPGQCILEELPYAYILCHNTRGSCCDFCFKKCSTLKKCTSCKYASYCSKSCQTGDWARCHKQDCKLQKRRLDFLDPVHLLSEMIHIKQRQSPPFTKDDEDCFPTSVDQLESHHENLSYNPSNRYNPRVNLEILSVHDYCIQEGIEPSSLLKMLGAILCNAFSILDNDLNELALGIYLRASMANHSCDPNCEVVFDGRKLQLRNIKDVKEGEECTISYIVDVTTIVKERQAELEKRYHFTCKCVRCVEEINPADGLGEDLQGLKTSWKQIQDAMDSLDWAKAFQLCEPYLKPMDSPPANYPLLVKVRDTAFNAYKKDSQSWEKAVEIGKLNTEPYRYHYGPYSANLGIFLLDMSKLLLNLERLQEARQYFTEAEKVLEVTHGRQHSLMLTSVQDVLRRCRESMA